MKKNFLVTLIIFITLLGCATVPFTGRRQISFVPQSELLSLSGDNYQKILKESKMSDDPNQIEMVRRVGDRLVKAVTDYMQENGQGNVIKNYSWEFNVIKDDKTINAFCLPGGKVAVYTGIFPVAKDDAGLATVLSHEIAHAIANHGGERMSQGLLVNLGELSLSQALKSQPAQTQQIWMTAFGLGSNIGIILPYGRNQENEADRIGLIIMAMAGYDPHAAVGLWERMKQGQKDGGPEFLSTHPATENRIQQIQGHIPEAMGYYRG